MSSFDKQSMIAAAKAKMDEKKKDQESRKNGSFSRDYEDVQWVGLEDMQPKMMRFLGNDFNFRKLSSDPKLVCISTSKITGDDGKMYKMVWPTKDENPNWIMWKIFNKVASYKWNNNLDNGKGGKGARDYIYAKTFPELLNRVLKNGKENPPQWENGWYPGSVLIWNVIDYMDDWCKENKHSKLLSKKITVKDDDSCFITEGIPYELYKLIYSVMVENYGFYDEYQTIVVKDSASKRYNIYHPIEDGNKKVVKEWNLKNIKNSFEDELDYKLYDIDKLFMVSTYHKIKKILGVYIQEVDKKLKTSFYPELEKLVEEEKIKFAEIYGKKDEVEQILTPINVVVTHAHIIDKKESIIIPSEIKSEKIEVKPMVSLERKPRETKKEEIQKFNPKSYIGKFPYIESLTPEELNQIINYDPLKDDFIYNLETCGIVYECQKCKKSVPEALKRCPTCNAEYT